MAAARVMKGPAAILFLTTETELKGGGEFFLRDAVKGLAPFYRVICALPHEGGLARCLRGAGAQVVFLMPSWSYKGKHFFRNHIELRRAAAQLAGQHAGVVYANAGHVGPFAVRLASLLRRPCLVHVHDVFDREGQGKYLFEKADMVLACSRYVAASIGGCEGRLNVVYNGVDTGVFTPEIRMPHEGFKVGIMGSVNRKKGFFEFVSMAERLVARIPGVAFVAIGTPKPGDEDVLRQLEADVGTRGLGSRFTWKGFSSAPQCDLAGMDVLVVPSQYEAFGRVVPEAFACGTPVVATRSGGPEEIIEDGRNGLLRAVGDVEGLAEAVMSFHQDPASCQRMAAAARADAVQRFSLGRMVTRLREIIDALLKSEGTKGSREKP